MKITFSDVTDLVAFLHPGLGGPERTAKVLEMEKNFARFCGEREAIFLSRNERRRIEGMIYCLKFQEGVFGAANARIDPGNDERIFAGLLKSVLAEVKKRGAKRLLSRLVSGPVEEGRSRVLSGFGFKPGPQRVEFRKELAELPGDQGSPLEWEAAGELSDEEFGRLAAILERASEGDPDLHPDDNANELLRGWLKERGLSSGSRCVHVGKADGKQAAIVVAQVDAVSGWSRITYMGLLPEFRGKGLGAWAQRHGFSMMREQGGKLYHGGTLAKNKAMIRLFERHGCERYREMREWELPL